MTVLRATGTHLTGLRGTNPLSFLAALGVQVIFAGTEDEPHLWWSKGILPHAIVSSIRTDQIAERAIGILPSWKQSPCFQTNLEPLGDVKYAPHHIRQYLEDARCSLLPSDLAHCLVAEGSLDNKGQAKPTDLYFTAGNQKFLSIATDLIQEVTVEDLLDALNGPWPYQRKLQTLMWDVEDDSNYALTANDPSKQSKLINPGVEALAILGLSHYPVFGSRNRTLTRGVSGSWKEGAFSWPMWKKPASYHAVSSLLAHTAAAGFELDRRSDNYRAWGITHVMQSAISRSAQGGYGTFRPAEVVWSCD